jgi:FtsH-binding integral membrane protein
LISAGVYTFAIFACFSVFAIITNKRTHIFAGAAIASLILSLVSLFLFRFSVLESLIGLALGILYVIIDTQMMIMRAESQNKDVFQDAKSLFIDFVKIFLRILELLSKDDKKKRRD